MTTSRQARNQRFRLTRTKRRTLELLAEYFCLRTRDIAHLLHDREPTPNDLRSSRRTLELLFVQGLVHRIRYIEPDRDRGGITYVHGLTDKGVACFGGKTFDDHSSRTLDHELGISFFHVALRRLPFKLFWKQSGLKRGIHPDALFALTNHKGTYYFFLEIERSKIGNIRNGEPSITRKLDRYAEYYDTDQCERDWNFRKFRVIVVQDSDTRRRHLLEVLRDRFPYRILWLTTEPLYKADMSGEIFATPRDYAERSHSLLGL
jgi:Replication-relaxation